MTCKSSSVNLPHFSRTSPLYCFHFPSSWSQFIVRASRFQVIDSHFFSRKKMLGISCSVSASCLIWFICRCAFISKLHFFELHCCSKKIGAMRVPREPVSEVVCLVGVESGESTIA